MKNICALTRVFLKENLFRNTEKNRIRKMIIYACVYIYLCWMVLSISYSCIIGLKEYGEEELFINAILVVYLLFITIRLIFSSMNVLYYSNDNDVISTYPVHDKDIVFSKLFTILFMEYIFEILVFIPSLIMYGVMTGMGVYFYVIVTFVGLVYPVIPIAIVSFVVSVFMRIFKFVRNKENVQYFAILLVFGFMVIVNILISGSADNEITNNDIAVALMTFNSKIENVFLYIPGLKIYAEALKKGISIEKFPLIILLSSIVFYLFGSVISNYYMKTIISMNTAVKSNKNKKLDFSSNSIAKSYFWKEMKIWFRHPLFLMQCILPPIVFPIIFLIPANASLKVTESNTSLIYISDVFMEENGILGLIVSVFILSMMFIFNYSSAVCVSKDGKNAAFMKYIPVSYSKQCLYKIIISLILNMFPIVYLVIIERFLLINIPLKIILYIVCIAIEISLYTSLKGIQIDLKNPKIDWGHEYAVVKQNFNIMVHMAISLLTFTITGIVLFVFNLFLGIDFSVITTIIIYTLLVFKNYKKIDRQVELFKYIE